MLNLIPQPAELQLTGKWFRRKNTVRKIKKSELKAEEYILEITEDELKILYSGSAGLRYAKQTLRQIQRQYPGKLPTLKIHDYPAFTKRGVMLDVTRGRVWTMNHLKETIRYMARWKYNFLQLYFEAAFASSGNEKIWKDMSPITPEELQELENYAEKYGIELSVCQNCFGHLTRFLIHPDYRSLAEIQPGTVYESWGRKSTVPQSLSPVNPESAVFIKKLLEDFFKSGHSGHINLGCDETLDLGFGTSQKRIKKDGIAKVFADYVNKLCSFVKQTGRIPMIWADFPLKHPETLELLPKDLILLLWGYESDSPFGEWCRTVRQSGMEYWVCPGTCSWSALFGNSERRRANMRKAAEEGLAEGASGYLVTDWGDGGHRQCWGPSLAAITEGACYAWSGTDKLNSAGIGREAFNSIAAYDWYDRAGQLEEPLKQAGLPTLYADLHLPWSQIPEKYQESDVECYRSVLRKLEQLYLEIPRDIPELLKREMSFSVKMALFSAKRALLRREGRAVELMELASQMPPLIREFKSLWKKRSRPGGLEWSALQWQKISDEMLNIC